MNTKRLDDACDLLNPDIPDRDWRALGGIFDYTVDLMGVRKHFERIFRCSLQCQININLVFHTVGAKRMSPVDTELLFVILYS